MVPGINVLYKRKVRKVNIYKDSFTVLADRRKDQIHGQKKDNQFCQYTYVQRQIGFPSQFLKIRERDKN